MNEAQVIGSGRPPIIRLRGMTKVFGSGTSALRALRGVNLDIEQGEFVAVMGASGSGKSTTMNIIGCLDVPTSGTYEFKGVHVERMTLHQLALLRRRYFGFVFQGFNLLARTSALENVELPLYYRGENRVTRRKAAMQALARVGLADRHQSPPAELSGGQQQRVAIARAIVTAPEVLLADEPTGNLDSETSIEIMTFLAHLNRDAGITIVMVTHEQEMAAFASTHVRFRDGVVDRIEHPQAPPPALLRGGA